LGIARDVHPAKRDAIYEIMCEFPFQLIVKRVPERQTECLLCTGLLRIVPGRRQVYDALWNQRNVIVKVFSHRLSSKRHLRREWQSLIAVAGRDLRVPEPLFYGQTGDGAWAVVVEKIAESSTALEVFDKLQDPAEILDLLILIGRELACQHIRGVLQKDLHLGNFLLQDEKVFLLDAAQMKFFPGEIDKKKSIAQLAMLAAWVPDSRKEAMKKLCGQYFEVRGWRYEKSDEVLFYKQLALHRKRAIKRGLKKSLRTSKRYFKITYKQYTAVFDRDFCYEDQTCDFIEQLDRLMGAGSILKNGKTCYVSRLTWNGNDIVVKRYNHKGLFHSLRHTIKGSRARSCWIHGHRLGMLNISTPKPLAYIEQRKGLLIWKSYLVTEYIQGQKLHDFLRDERVNQERRSSVMQQVKELLDRLGKHHIIHGDLKHTNILITKNGPVLTDLDSVQVHKYNWTYRIKRAKDLAHFE